MKRLTLKASCLCGGIQFKTHGYHRDIENCHCIQCMKTHGHYAAYTNVQEQNIKFLKKRTLKWFRSSKRAKRGFCRKCWARLFFKLATIVTLGDQGNSSQPDPPPPFATLPPPLFCSILAAEGGRKFCSVFWPIFQSKWSKIWDFGGIGNFTPPCFAPFLNKGGG